MVKRIFTELCVCEVIEKHFRIFITQDLQGCHLFYVL